MKVKSAKKLLRMREYTEKILSMFDVYTGILKYVIAITKL